MTNASTLRQAIDRLIADDDLATFVATRRQTGRSWRRIGIDLRDETGIDVSYETLRSWFPDEALLAPTPSEAAG